MLTRHSQVARLDPGGEIITSAVVPRPLAHGSGCLLAARSTVTNGSPPRLGTGLSETYSRATSSTSVLRRTSRGTLSGPPRALCYRELVNDRVQLEKSDPTAYEALSALSALVERSAAAADISISLMELIRLRVSQINNCAFCMRTHARAALDAGETADRIAVLPQWSETSYFSDRERAALELAEAVTLINHGPVPQPLYERVSVTLSEQEISAVSWIAIVMNSFNRVRVTNRQKVRTA